MCSATFQLSPSRAQTVEIRRDHVHRLAFHLAGLMHLVGDHCDVIAWENDVDVGHFEPVERPWRFTHQLAEFGGVHPHCSVRPGNQQFVGHHGLRGGDVLVLH